MGSTVADILLDKKGIEITGVCDRNPDNIGKDFISVLGRDDKINNKKVIIESDIEKIIKPGSADILILATDSFTEKAFPKIKYILENRINIISTAEEMSYPSASEPEIASAIDLAARENNVSVLGTGINPGFIMDLMVVMLTGVCRDVSKINVERINSLSPFGPAVMEEQGVGLSPEDFEKGIKSKTLAGHVGFNESVKMICDAVGWKADGKPVQTMKAIISNTERKTKYTSIKPGEAAGCRQEGRGFVGGREMITMIHPQQIEPESEGVDTGDYIKIRGVPDINLSIKPEIPGGTGTAAICVNMIPHVINANPGLKTMLDLPVPRAVLGDMREYIDRDIE